MAHTHPTPPSAGLPAFDHVRVREVMHPGILTCDASAPLGEVAGIMATHHVHAVVVHAGGAPERLAVISDLDLVAAMAAGEPVSARAIAATDPLTVPEHAPVRAAMQQMVDHAVSHLVVVDQASGRPTGVVSSLDLAALYADR